MKQNLRLFILTLLCAMVGNVWAETYKSDFSDGELITLNEANVTSYVTAGWLTKTSSDTWNKSDVSFDDGTTFTTDTYYKVKQYNKKNIVIYVKGITSLTAYFKNTNGKEARSAYYTLNNVSSDSGTELASVTTTGSGTISDLDSNTEYAINFFASGDLVLLGFKVTASSTGLKTPTINIAPTSITVGGTATISVSEGVSYTATCDKTSIATISDDYTTVTGVALGTCNITVTTEANDNYEAVTKTFEITVKNEFVAAELTAVSDATVWDWTSWEETVALDESSTPTKKEENVYQDYISLELVESVPFDDATTMAFQGQYPVRNGKSQAGTWHFKTTVPGFITVDFSDTGSSGTGSNRYLKVNDEETEYYTCRDGSTSDRKVSGEIYVPAGDVYITGSSAICVYKITFSPYVNVSISEVGYATLYYKNVPLTVPANVTATTYSASGTELTVDCKYEEGDVIPANEAVVLKGSKDVYKFYVGTETTGKSESSALYGTDEETEINDEGYKYYILSLASGSNDSSTVGFYYQVEGGESVTNGAHKAYLKVAEDSAAKSFYLFGSETTGLKNLNVTESEDNAPVYDLQGRRVETPSKGIYIKNNRKFVVK